MIDLEDVSKSYGPGLPAVNHVNLHVDKGEFVFVVGSSGSGKSTLIKLLMKELDSTSGTITVSGERLEGMRHRRVAKYRRKLGVVFQDFRLLKDRDVYENVAFAQRVIGRPTRVIRKRVPEVLQEVGLAGKYKSYPSTLIKLLMKELDSTSGTITVSGERLEGMRHRRVAKYRRKLGVVFQDFRLLKDRDVYENVAFAQRVIGRPTRVIRKRVPEVLQEVGLAGKYKSYPDELSGGEQQRVALARALVNRPDILLADEPTGNLDPKTSEEIMALLEQINERGTTVLVVTHNKEIVNAMKKRVLTMHDGVIVSDEKEGGYHEA